MTSAAQAIVDRPAHGLPEVARQPIDAAGEDLALRVDDERHGLIAREAGGPDSREDRLATGRGDALGIRTAGHDAIIVGPQLAALIDCARDLAWRSHCNVVGLEYHERRESFARLRGALAAYDEALT